MDKYLVRYTSIKDLETETEVVVEAENEELALDKAWYDDQLFGRVVSVEKVSD